MQPTNFPALVNNFSNEKQNKNRKKIIIKKGQGSFRSRIPPVGYFSFFSTETTKPVKKTHNGRAATGTNPIKREKIFNFFFFFLSHVIIGPPIPSEKQIGQNWKSFPFCTVTWHACIPARKEKKVQSQIFFLSRKVFFSFQKILPLKDALESILKIEHNSGSARTLGQKT